MVNAISFNGIYFIRICLKLLTKENIYHEPYAHEKMVFMFLHMFGRFSNLLQKQNAYVLQENGKECKEI